MRSMFEKLSPSSVNRKLNATRYADLTKRPHRSRSRGGEQGFGTSTLLSTPANAPEYWRPEPHVRALETLQSVDSFLLHLHPLHISMQVMARAENTVFLGVEVKETKLDIFSVLAAL